MSVMAQSMSSHISQLQQLQHNTDNIRNLCILAHVDHGKTTLADALIASNGIISERLAGKLRYMDSRQDEQQRGITMKSSAISLQYAEGDERYLINLLDSPGHVDFSSEVSTAVRLCDGAVVVVDVVEGVCSQTKVVLRQAWLERIKPVLVLNKIDRLIVEKKMTGLEVYQQLVQILEQVNAITGELFTSDVFEKTSLMSSHPRSDEHEVATEYYDWSAGLEDTDDSNLYFSPELNNVVFASALDGWGFTIENFSEIISKKMLIKEDVLRKTLWGDYYLNSKAKRIQKGAQVKAKKPLFVHFILDNIISVYEEVCVRRDEDKIEKILRSLHITLPARDMRHSDARVQLRSILMKWLPLSQAVLKMVCHHLPSPHQVPEEKVERLLSTHAHTFQSLPPQTQQLKQAFISCSSSPSAPVIAYVSKLFPIDKKSLPEHRVRPLTVEQIAERRELARQRHATPCNHVEGVGEDVTTQDAAGDGDGGDGDDTVFVAFARIFSGVLRPGQELYVLHPKHDPHQALLQSSRRVGGVGREEDGVGDEEGDVGGQEGDVGGHLSEHVAVVRLGRVFILMGREVEEVGKVAAGNVLGITGLQAHLVKSGTLASTVACPAFTDMYHHAPPILRVAVEPAVPREMNELVRGLKLLNQADPCVQVLVQQTGEHVLLTAGEVHLQRCLDDLQQSFAKVAVKASTPIAPFRETIVPAPKLDRVNEVIEEKNPIFKHTNHGKLRESEHMQVDGVLGRADMRTADGQCEIGVSIVPLPPGVTQLLEGEGELLRTLHQQALVVRGQSKACPHLTTNLRTALDQLKDKMDALFTESGDAWRGTCDQIWAFGPNHHGPNILVNRVEGYRRPSVWHSVEKSYEERLRELDNSMVTGFQLATLAGPMCEEPMMGVCYVVNRWETSDRQQHTHDNDDDDDDDGGAGPRMVGDEVASEHSGSSSRHTGYGPLSGQVMASMKEGCRRLFTTRAQRLMAAMYSCEIQASADVLGRMYGVVARRQGKVLHEEMIEGSNIFHITATLPVAESIGFSEEIRKKTSGLATPQLMFSHWEVIELDPYWEPSTEEEYTLYGEKADSENRARSYLHEVRRRKGLAVTEKIIEHAEKQRTLKIK